ncbi:MAG TPA: hypothetical protein VLA92_01450 [Candidatus Saccharimonadales bacterium]|nr:hypothetical protein [Candidatus Saccharimonadales bacterium]
MSAETLRPAAEAYPELEELCTLAERITSPESLQVADAELGLPEGVRREVGEGRVTFARDYSPTSFDRTVFHTEFAGNGPTIVSQRMRPATEEEGFGSSLLEVITFPLDASKVPALTRMLGRFSNNSNDPHGAHEFVPTSLLEDDYMSSEKGAVACRRLLSAARLLTGTSDESVAPLRAHVSRWAKMLGAFGLGSRS